MREIFVNPDVDRVYVSIVHYNSLTSHNPEIIRKSFSAILQQTGFTLGKDLFVRVCDNASEDQTYNFLQELVAGKDVFLQKNPANLGFSAAHNQGVAKFLSSNCNYLLILNPDLALAPNALQQLMLGLKESSEAGLAAAKLFRGNDSLEKENPPRLDSAGMILTSSLRHFDRGSNEIDQGQYSQKEFVFGVTGACMLLKKSAVQRILLQTNRHQPALYQIYPQLEHGILERLEMFDESFFAYREDADLCWRAANLGIKTIYIPTATGVHRRVVLSNNRQSVSPKLNYLSVRNRFLLQINNYHFWAMPQALINGILWRNLLVLIASILVERSSLPAFLDLRQLFRRAWSNRKFLIGKMGNERL